MYCRFGIQNPALINFKKKIIMYNISRKCVLMGGEVVTSHYHGSKTFG